MSAYFSIGKAQKDCDYIPRLGELIQYSPIDDVWEIRIGDGKTQAKDLPRLYDIHDRVTKLEQEIAKLKLLLI